MPQLARLGVPVVQAPSANRPAAEWAADDAGLTPLEVASGVALPEFDGRVIAPAFAFKEAVDDGGDLGAPVIASRTVPDRTARVAGLAVRHGRLRPHPARRTGGWRSCCRPTRPSAAASATPWASTRRPAPSACSGRCATPATGSTASPSRGDALMAELSAGLTYEEPAALRRAGRPGGGPPRRRAVRRLVRRPARPTPARWSRACGARRRARCTSTATPWRSPASTWAACSSRSSRPGASAPTRSAPTTPPTCPRPTTTSPSTGGSTRAGAPTPSSTLGKHGTLEWLPGKANALSRRLLPRRRARRPAVRVPVRGQRPGRGHPGQAAGARHDRRPPAAAADPGRHLRRPRPAGAAARRLRPGPGHGPGQAARAPGPGVGGGHHRRPPPRPRLRATLPDDEAFDEAVLARRRLPVRAEGRPDPRRPPRARACRRRARRWSTPCWP